jgi:hypothetical protein
MGILSPYGLSIANLSRYKIAVEVVKDPRFVWIN